MNKTHDFSLSAYENEKQNFIATRSAQNRFGVGFKKFFNRHKSIRGEYAEYDFTAGLRSIFDKKGVQDDIDKADALLSDFTLFATRPTGTTYSLDDALLSSYVRMRFTYNPDGFGDGFSLIEYGITISSSLDASATDKRKKSAYLGELNLSAKKYLRLDPLEDVAETFGVHLFRVDGTEYGHYASALPDTLTSEDIDTTFTTDAYHDKNADGEDIFNPNLQTGFDDFKEEFERYLQEYALSTEYLNTMSTTDDDVLLFSLGQLYDYIQDDKAQMQAYISDADTDARAKDDMDLIELLQLKDSLKKNITKPHKVKTISFRFQKECTMPENGKWWEAMELEKMKPLSLMKKSIEKHCDVQLTKNIALGDNEGDLVAPGEKFWIYPKDSFLILPPWQICLFVQTFMDIHTRVKKKWYQKSFFKVLTAIVTVALIVMTENPTWVKILMISTALGSQFGLIGGDLQILITAAMMIYGVATVDFSSMSGLEMFNFAVQNVNMTANIVQVQKQASLTSQFHERQKVIDDYYLSKKQDEVMRYIYTDSYDEYSTFYNLLYQY